MMKQRQASKHSKKAWAVLLCALSVITFSQSSFAGTEQKMEYDVYAGGFHVVSADLDVDLSKKNKYALHLGAYTHGTLAKLAPWSGIFETRGWYDSKKQSPQAEIHFSKTQWRDEIELTEFLYNKDGSFKEYRLTNDDKKGVQPTDPALSGNTTDVLTATLKVMNKIAAGGKCEGSDEIFDGDRRYMLHYAHQGSTELKANNLNVYSGPATECTIEVKPMAGKWHKKPRGWMSIQEQGRERGMMPTIWFAQIAAGEPAVPVKIRVKTQYGALMMHLTGYQGGGKTLAIQQK